MKMQNNNRKKLKQYNKPVHNKSGHKNIGYKNYKWVYEKKNIKTYKRFDNKIDAICYKFIMILKYKLF
jgi:hypothetical protein